MAASSLADLKSRRFWTAVVAELLGTLFLVLVACGSCTGWEKSPPTVVQIALCFGLSVASIVWAIANISGGHINPAVTLGFLATRRISLVRAIMYIVAQVGGAIVGAAILKAVTPSEVQGGLGTSTSDKLLNGGQVFGVELLITFIFVFVIFATCDGQRSDLAGSGPLAIGLSLAMCHLWAVKYTGAGMNPARVFGPALISNTWQHHWAYWFGPAVGGILAGLLYDFVFAVNANPTKARGYFTRHFDNDNYDKHGQKSQPDNSADVKMEP